MALLDVKNLSISFGGLRAVDGFEMQIEKGELYGLIGPNGAGKTTVFNLLTGVYKPNEGIIKLDGEDITGKKTIDINKAGIARTFQNIRLFKQLSVLDNVKVGLHNHYKYSTLEGILRLPKYKKVEKAYDDVRNSKININEDTTQIDNDIIQAIAIIEYNIKNGNVKLVDEQVNKIHNLVISRNQMS